MPKVIIVEEFSEIDARLQAECPASKWEKTTKFSSYSRLVNEHGALVAANSNGRKFQILDKRVYRYSLYERIYRVSLGLAMALITFGTALFNKRVKHLITKQHISRRFAVPFETGLVVKTSRGEKTDVQIIFQDPVLQDGRPVNFARVQEGEQSELLLVTHTPMRVGGKREFIGFQGNLPLALFEFAKQPLNLMEAPYVNATGHFCSVLENLDKEELESFFTLVNQKDPESRPSLHQFNAASLLATLMFAKEKKMRLDLSRVDDKEETLFTKWIKTSEVRITKLLYEIDSKVLPDDKIADYLDNAILQGFGEQAIFLKKIARKKKVKLPFSTWCRLAVFIPDPTDRLRKIDSAVRLEMYRLGNAYGKESLVQKLEPYFEEELKVSKPNWPGILFEYRSIIAIKGAVGELLGALRTAGKLLTREEFARIDSTQFEEVSVDFGFLQGEVYLEELVKQEKLTPLKIRSYLAVWEGSGDPCFKIVEGRLTPMALGWRFFKQQVRQFQRHFTVQEIEAIAKFVVKSAYSARRLHVPNIFQIAEKDVVVTPQLSFFYRHGLEEVSRKEPVFLNNWIEDVRRFADSETAALFATHIREAYKLNLRPKQEDGSEIRLLTPFDNFKFDFKI